MTRRSAARWAGPVAIGLAALAMLAWSWRKWPDVQVDFGRELYVAWQLAEGKTLYTDLAYFNGPFSPYLNALWFRLFGVSLMTLALCNVAIAAGLIGLVYWMLSRISDRGSATAAGLLFVTVFGFGQVLEIGNYNFVCPYSHELTHGLVLSAAALTCLWAYHRTGRPWTMVACGILVGLSFLTKVEVFAAIAVSVAVGVGLTIWVTHPSPREAATLVARLVGGGIVCVAAALGALACRMPLDRAIGGLLGGWSAAATRDVLQLPFYQWVMGTWDLAGNVMRLLWWCAWYVIVLLPIGVLSLALRTSGIFRALAAAMLVIIVGLPLATWWVPTAWGSSAYDALRPLPVVLLFIMLGCGRWLIRARREGRSCAEPLLALTMAVWAFGLLGKILLNVHAYHYGFALAMPGTLLLAVALVGWIPAWLAKRGGSGEVFRAGSLACLVAFALSHLSTTAAIFSENVYPIGDGRDRFLADARGQQMAQALEYLQRQLGAEQTLVVLPEGVMLNYLARRRNPTPYTNFMPPEVILFGEGPILEALQAHPPDSIALVHKDTREYGAGFFGSGYGMRIFRWVRDNYREVQVIGSRPFVGEAFGIAILERIGGASERGGSESG